MRKWLIVFLMIFSVQQTKAQLKTYHFNQLDSLQKIAQRPVCVFIYTSWCNYCNAMKQTTFKDKAIVDTLNKRYYLVALNAEDKSTFKCQNRLFKYDALKNLNELVIELAKMDGKIAYPTTCILTISNQITFQSNQYVNAEQLSLVLSKLPHN